MKRPDGRDALEGDLRPEYVVSLRMPDIGTGKKGTSGEPDNCVVLLQILPPGHWRDEKGNKIAKFLPVLLTGMIRSGGPLVRKRRVYSGKILRTRTVHIFNTLKLYYHVSTVGVEGMNRNTLHRLEIWMFMVIGLVILIHYCILPVSADIDVPPVGPGHCVMLTNGQPCPDEGGGGGGGTSGGSSDYYYVSGPSCSPGYHIYTTSGGQCCPDGYPFFYNGQCHSCSQGYYKYDSSAGQCCPDGYPYYYNGMCYQCSQGYYKFGTSGGKCCPAGYPYYYNGQCWQCQQGSVYDTASGMCCPGDYPNYYNGRCYECAQGYSKYATSNGQCCQNGFPYYFDGQCWKCQKGSSYDEASGTCCPEDHPFYHDGKCNECEKGFSKSGTSNGHCCPEGYPYFSGDACYQTAGPHETGTESPTPAAGTGTGVTSLPSGSPTQQPAVSPTTQPSVTLTRASPDSFIPLPQPLTVPYSAVRDYYETLRTLVNDIWQRGLLRPAEGSSHPAGS